MFTVRDLIMVGIGVGGTYALIRFTPVLIQDIKLGAYKLWDYIKNELIKLKP